MNLKEIATDFILAAARGDVHTAFSTYTTEKFIHHNQYFGGSRQEIMQAMIEDHKTNPNLSFDIKYLYQDGDRVITHSYVKKEAMEIAVIHIFRFEQDKIVEMWDIGQVFIEDMPNKYGLF